MTTTQFHFWRDGLWRLGAVAYAVNRWIIAPVTGNEFMGAYFNDLWLIPVAIPLMVTLHQGLGLRNHTCAPRLGEIMGHVAVWSVVCEVLGPGWFGRATGDPLDVVAYTIGGLVAWLWWRRRWR